MARKTVAQLKTEASKKQVLEYLAESGNISFSCKRAGISRETYYRWIDEDRPFSASALESISSGKSFINDLAHTHLVKNIQQGDMQAIRFQLSNCHPDYRPKAPMKDEVEPVSRIELFDAHQHPDLQGKIIEPYQTTDLTKQ